MSESKSHDPIQGEIVHEYDGILEADNHLPKWWVYTFVVSMLFGIGYWYFYEIFKVDEYQSEAFARAQAQMAQASSGTQ